MPANIVIDTSAILAVLLDEPEKLARAQRDHAVASYQPAARRPFLDRERDEFDRAIQGQITRLRLVLPPARCWGRDALTGLDAHPPAVRLQVGFARGAGIQLDVGCGDDVLAAITSLTRGGETAS